MRKAKSVQTSIRGIPASKRLRYDPVRDRCYWLTEHAGLMNIEDVNPFCLGHIMAKLAAEGKEESLLYEKVERCAERRGVLQQIKPDLRHTGWQHGD